jgi:CheY-like chemotaxis protein
MSMTVLVVDDEPHMRKLIEIHLKRAGHIVISAKNGREALTVAGEKFPDLIVMDVMMSEMDGLTALAQLKSDPATHGIPVIMLTARGHTMTRQEAEESGAESFLNKPFSPTQLLTEIQRLASK